MRRLRRWLALSPAERAIVHRSLLLLPVVELLLKTHGMGRAHVWLESRAPLAVRDTAALAPLKIAILVDAAACFLRARCLTRSLVLWHWLRDRGAPAEIRLGVSKRADGGLSAHAWVEFDGLPLNAGQDLLVRYAALPSPPRRHPAGHPATLRS